MHKILFAERMKIQMNLGRRGVNGIRILNRFQGWGVGLTAESIALTIAEKYCGSCKGSQPTSQPVRQAGRGLLSLPHLCLLEFKSQITQQRGKKKNKESLPPLTPYSLGFD